VTSASEVLRGLDDEQRAVAEATEGPVMILAGAGTGKTTAITHRIAYATVTGKHDARRTMAVTFTNRAAGNMRARLSDLGVSEVQVRTFHSAALRQLRHFWPRIAPNRQLPRLAANPQPLLEQAAARAHLSMTQTHVRYAREGIDALRMRRVSASIVSEQQAASAAGDLAPEDFIRLWRAYDEVKTESAVMDFTDVLAVTVGMFAMHPELLREVHRTYRWFTVDEYQDVSPLQWDLLQRWRGSSDEVCVVGDANQTIYSFAGASPNYLLEFGTQFDDATRVVLTRCYRSTPQIVAMANTVMATAPTFLELRSQRPDGIQPSVTEYSDDRAEVAGIADQIADALAGGLDPRDVAVLIRTNAQAAPFTAALTDRGIPVVTRGVDRFFQRPEVKEAMLRLRAATTSDLVSTVRETLSAMPGASSDSAATLGALAEDLAAQYRDVGTVATVADFLAHMQERARQEHAPTPYGVTVSTLHAAKGLEWSLVFLAGWSEGLVPLDGADIDEERRLAYVGMTRARDRLEVSWATRRSVSDTPRMISRFLTGVGATVGTPSGPGPLEQSVSITRSSPAICRICGRALVSGRERTLMRCAHCPSTADPKLVESLRLWRRTCAITRDVPEYQVLTDVAIEAVAELKPRSTEALLSIPGTRWLGSDASNLLEVVGGVEAGHPFVED